MLCDIYTPPQIIVLPGQYTVSQLMAMDPAQYARCYAFCSDLFDGVGDMCLSDGNAWKPVRPETGVRTVTNANADGTLICMVNAPTQLMRGALSANRSWTLSTQYAYRGARFRVKREATGTLLSLLVNGIGLGLNSWIDHEFDGTAWVQTASGGLL